MKKQSPSVGVEIFGNITRAVSAKFVNCSSGAISVTPCARERREEHGGGAALDSRSSRAWEDEVRTAVREMALSSQQVRNKRTVKKHSRECWENWATCARIFFVVSISRSEGSLTRGFKQLSFVRCLTFDPHLPPPRPPRPPPASAPAPRPPPPKRARTAGLGGGGTVAPITRASASRSANFLRGKQGEHTGHTALVRVRLQQPFKSESGISIVTMFGSSVLSCGGRS